MLLWIALYRKPDLVMKSCRNKPVVLFNVRISLHPILDWLCTYQCIAPPPPLGRKWGFTGGIDTKLLPHYGKFDDRSVSAQIFFVVTSFSMSNPELIPCCNWGQQWGFDRIGLPYYGAFDIWLCQIPTIAP